jgi:PTS system nitrogen regulatory IIA component
VKLQLTAIRRKLANREAVPADLARVAGWLAPKLFLLEADARCTEGALRLAAQAIGPAHGIDPVLVFDALRRREQAASTALGAGFAIPHARLPGIGQPVTAFIRLRKPMPFGATDGMPVSHLLVILVPKDGDDGDHLKMLSLIAELFSQGAFRKQIALAPDVVAAQDAFARGIADLLRTAHAGRAFA